MLITVPATLICLFYSLCLLLTCMSIEFVQCLYAHVHYSKRMSIQFVQVYVCMQVMHVSYASHAWVQVHGICACLPQIESCKFTFMLITFGTNHSP